MTRRIRVSRVVAQAAVAAITGTLVGCTAESTRTALAMQRRADQVQESVFEQQQESLRILIFRDLTRRLDDAGELNEEQLEALNLVWNERDLLEFWGLQNERAKALRQIGVDLKLFADQSMLDLIIKQIETKADRMAAAAAGASAAQAVRQAVEGGAP